MSKQLGALAFTHGSHIFGVMMYPYPREVVTERGFHPPAYMRWTIAGALPIGASSVMRITWSATRFASCSSGS
jgi:hypothetical protein